jgi:hypothetical protein
MMEPLPPWLSSPVVKPAVVPDAPGNREQLMALEQQNYEIAYELALEHIADGNSLTSFCNDYSQRTSALPNSIPVSLSPTRFRTWIMRDHRRRKAFEAAKLIGADAIAESLTRISDGLNPDGTPSMNDVGRSSLMVATRKWLLQVTNREKYGDVKRVDQTITSTTDLNSLSSADLKRLILRESGIDAEDLADLDLNPDAA